VKTLFIFLILIFTAGISLSQEKTILTSNIEHGGYGAPVIKGSAINGNFGLFVGGRGGWILNHTFAIGLGGYGLVNSNTWDNSFLDVVPRLTMGYGGLEIEVIINSDKIVHFTIHSLIGYGAVDYLDDDYLKEFSLNTWKTADAFFVAEPAFNVDINITTFFRLGVGVSYRYISGVELVGITNEDLSGFTGNLVFKFGGF
jgi:hypothetical protein